MTPYSAFARYYDLLTANIDYGARAAYFDWLIREYRPERGLLLDLACGTGSLSWALAELGYDVTGVDRSGEMLSRAMEKCGATESRVLFLRQRMEDLDLYGTMDAVVCALDSVNHLPPDALRRVIGRLALFTHPGAVFAFDVNTLYKHREILAGRSFIYDLDEVFCAWQGELLPDGQTVEIALDFFGPDGKGKYIRSTERFREYIHSEETLRGELGRAGFEVMAVYEADTQNPPGEKSERLVYVSKKLG